MGYVFCCKVGYSKGSGSEWSVVTGKSGVAWGGREGSQPLSHAHHGRADGGECAGIHATLIHVCHI